jgi:hypothetical protein
MSNPEFFSKIMSNIDFFQNLFKNTPPSMTALGSWVTPTLDPEEINKRIQELKIVQFWLEQNARLLTSTIQALEVQKLTLATLQSMNIAGTTPHFGGTAEPADKAPSSESAPQATPDPLQWWGALTQQFTQIAAQAMQESVSAVQPIQPHNTNSHKANKAAPTSQPTAPTAAKARRKKSASAPPQ